MVASSAPNVMVEPMLRTASRKFVRRNVFFLLDRPPEQSIGKPKYWGKEKIQTPKLLRTATVPPCPIMLCGESWGMVFLCEFRPRRLFPHERTVIDDKPASHAQSADALSPDFVRAHQYGLS
jgi:hypothetical protein